MGPNHDRQPDISAPAAMPDVASSSGGQEMLPISPEQSPESSPAIRSAPPASQTTPTIANPVSSLAKPTAPAVNSTSVSDNTNPAIADDKDLIEKEWVEKAKRIVETTKADPYKQTKEINHFKADYLKKRYNKELKVAED